MARFGERWVDHPARIEAAWRARIAPEDVILLPGDVSWAHTYPKLMLDLAWLSALPGRKVLLRGNHDHWWKNIDAVRKILTPLGFYALEGDSLTFDGVTICGAMGHIAPADPYYVEDPKKDRFHRELTRLELALEHGAAARLPGAPLLLMMHYPPFTSEGKLTAFVDLITRYQPTLCIYGHLHRSAEWLVATNGEYEGVTYQLLAADFIEMTPQLLWTTDIAAITESVETEEKT